MALAEELPQIVTESVPGPKTQEFLKRRNEAVPYGLCGDEECIQALYHSNAGSSRIWK